MSVPAQMRRGFADFFHLEVSGSIVLLVATISAMILANSPLTETYFALWETKIGIKVGTFEFIESLLHWINDGLMAVFFFVVGLEIKREFMVGELSSLRKATLPVMAAIGGMLIPALTYIIFNADGAGIRGWGVPMATDIAFALGVLALLGSRIPVGLKVFLTALAIADDIGAVLVIAFFYTAEIHWYWLGIAALLFLLLVSFNVFKVRASYLYLIVAIGIWFAFFESGVHATIAGVLTALFVPTQPRRRPIEFVVWGREKLNELEQVGMQGHDALENHPQHVLAEALRQAARHVQSPLRRLEHTLHPITTYAILPLFALANAGIPLSGGRFFDILLQPVSLGIVAGLVLGKQIGITLFSFLAIRLGLADLPTGVSWVQLYGASWLGGIGFTMSIFVSGLAFLNDSFILQAKAAILVASVIAGIFGFLILFLTSQSQTTAETSEAAA
ncbi:MAG: Na+/H+ antiporter NhaA [Chloroflexi bacterium]|nr:MAG: Na+/H+ antiporter NhaA [Chloroflexota bacterium]